MTTLAEQREAEQHALLMALIDSAHEYADETVTKGYCFNWMKLGCRTMLLTPHILWEMTHEHAMTIRTQALAHGLKNHPAGVGCVKTLLGWEALNSDWRSDRMDEGIAQEFFARVIVTVHLFSNSKEEAAHLVLRLIRAIIDAYCADLTDGYPRQMVDDQKILYGGLATGAVPEAESRRRNELLTHMREYYQIPALNESLVWTAS